ncbi:hypothetical protein Bca52824_026495 [Brassica carinata]|uniref:Uncharacterized protein n=1 Tax=Brassica carinata TaxID=52824 RepID=A0A8X7SIP4_BRACI|nr:hypothetical protein Bca52824_026495 [Brassica carinata]
MLDSSNGSKRKGSNSMKAMKKRQKTATPWPEETVEDKYPLGPPAQKADECPTIPKKKRHNHKNRRAKELAMSAANKIARERQA